MTGQAEQEFSTEAEATVAECFATITDFDRYTEWSGPVRQIAVLQRGPNKLARQVEFHVDMKLRTVRYVLQYTYKKPTQLTWHSVDGDIESIVGSYLFEKLTPKRTLVTCRQAVALGFWLPGAIRSVIERQALRQSVLEFKAEVERRSASKGRKKRS